MAANKFDLSGILDIKPKISCSVVVDVEVKGVMNGSSYQLYSRQRITIAHL